MLQTIISQVATLEDFDTYLVQGFDFWPLKMGPIGCPEMSVRNYHYSLHNNLEDGSSLFGTASLMRQKCFAQERCSTFLCVRWKLLVRTWHSTWADISFEPCNAFHINQPLLAVDHFLQVGGRWVDESQTYSCSTVENKGYYHLLDIQSNFESFCLRWCMDSMCLFIKVLLASKFVKISYIYQNTKIKTFNFRQIWEGYEADVCMLWVS